jgi:hypothetical protein
MINKKTGERNIKPMAANTISKVRFKAAPKIRATCNFAGCTSLPDREVPTLDNKRIILPTSCIQTIKFS